MWRLNLSPQIRYSHWKATSGLSEPVLDQVELLVGIDPAVRSDSLTNTFGRFSGGFIAGIGLGDDLPSASARQVDATSISPESNSGLYGAMLEFQVHDNLTVEADGIYRPLHYTTSDFGETGVRQAILTWEFPMLAKYKFPTFGRLRPLAELGPSFRLSGNLQGGAPSPYGATAGGGVEVRVTKVKIAPTLRYTRWAPGAGLPVNRWEILLSVYL